MAGFFSKLFGFGRKKEEETKVAPVETQVTQPEPQPEVIPVVETVAETAPVVEAVEAAPVVEAVAETVAAAPVVEAVIETVEVAPIVEVIAETVETAPVVEAVTETVEVAPIVEVIAETVEVAPIVEAVAEAVETAPVVEAVAEVIETTPVVEVAPIVAAVAEETEEEEFPLVVDDLEVEVEPIVVREFDEQEVEPESAVINEAEIVSESAVEAETVTAVIEVAPEAEVVVEDESIAAPVIAEVAEQPEEAIEAVAVIDDGAPLAAEVDDNTQEKPTREGFFARLKRSLQRTKESIGSGFFGLFRGKKIDDELFEDLETQLLSADLGVDTTMRIIDNLTQHASRRQLKDGEALYELLKEDMADLLREVEQPLVIDTTQKPYVILMVGVNGVGKTTTIGKLAKQFQSQGKSVMLAAGDTFRAAAVEQLQVWGQRNNIPVIAQPSGSDSASVLFDAMESARARKIDVLIADTAGRLQNKNHLMEELKKIVRVMKKFEESAPHEIMLTVDAGTGQNAISQAALFHEAIGLTGITLTKLDGTAKGGVIFAVADKFKLPIRYIGVGEGIDDLRPFVANDFIEALFSREE